MYKIFVKVLLMTFTLNLAIAQSQDNSKHLKELEDYANKIYRTIKENSLYADQIDWDSLRTELHNELKNTKNKEDLIPFFSNLYSTLGDFHGGYYFKGKRYGMASKEVDIFPNLSAGFSAGATSRKDVIENQYGYLFLPPINTIDQTDRNKSALQIQKSLCELADQRIPYLILDLRLNLGGDMWAMLAGLAQVLGDGIYGQFINSNSDKVSWYVKEGNAYCGDEKMTDIKYHCGSQLFEKVAVMVSPATSSSGEAIAISFKNNQNFILLGECTSGYTTSNEIFSIDNKTKLLLATAYMTDADGIYEECIDPEIQVSSMGANFEDLANDLQIIEAIKWFERS